MNHRLDYIPPHPSTMFFNTAEEAIKHAKQKSDEYTSWVMQEPVNNKFFLSVCCGRLHQQQFKIIAGPIYRMI